MLASGLVAISPSSVRASSTFWSAFKNSGKLAKILPAKEISFGRISIAADFVNACTIGKKE